LADLEAHIRELAKRVEREPGSRFFVPLADEYRKAGRLADAIATLEGGLTVHGGYVAARIALARAYLEAGRIDDSISAFSKALADDPSNLVAAKALGDLHLSRGEPLEALIQLKGGPGIWES
jgi:tetratricopeptide (TPR) repeat protein